MKIFKQLALCIVCVLFLFTLIACVDSTSVSSHVSPFGEAFTQSPIKAPTVNITKKPQSTVKETDSPVLTATPTVTSVKTVKPTVTPAKTPTVKPTKAPTKKPTAKATVKPTKAPTEKPTSDTVTVYIGKTGTKYHRKSCRTLKTAYPITLEEALNQGRDACKVCKP